MLGLSVLSAQDQNERATASVASRSRSDLRVGRGGRPRRPRRAKRGREGDVSPVAVAVKCGYVPLKCDMVPPGQDFCSVRRVSQFSETRSRLLRSGGDFTSVTTVRMRVFEAL